MKCRIRTLIFEATAACSLNCRHCYNVQKISAQYPKNLLDTAHTVQVLKEALNQTGCEQLILTGGEIYTRPDVNEILEAVQDSRVRSIHIMTNGSFLDAEKVAFAKAHRVRLFEISFISADKAVFDAESRAVGFSAFDNAVAATQECIRQNVLVSHVFVATKRNIATLPETLKLSYALGVRNFSFNRFNPCGNGRDCVDELQLSPAEITEALKICEAFAVVHPDLAIHAPINIPPCLVNLRPFKHITFTLCGVGFKQNILVMDYLGNIRLCSFSPTIIGNVRDMSIDAMFHSDRAAQFIQAHPRFCDSCKIVKKCQGGCKASADNCFGDAARENPFLARYKTEPLRGFWRVK